MMFFAAIENESFDDKEYMMYIYDKYVLLMFSTARKFVVEPTTVEDLVQDALVRLIPKVSTMRKLSCPTLTAYVVYTVRNTAINYLRHNSVKDRYIAQEELGADSVNLRDDELTPEKLLLLSERTKEFTYIWDRLPEDDRELLRGKYILGLNDKELAKLLGCKADSIRMKLTRARRRALQELKEGEFKL
jgi:RNA polymerase sigma-70 factor (ECF subfamily)